MFTPKKSPKSVKSSRSGENIISQDEMKAIKADTVNCKLWEECLEKCKDTGKQVCSVVVSRQDGGRDIRSVLPFIILCCHI